MITRSKAPSPTRDLIHGTTQHASGGMVFAVRSFAPCWQLFVDVLQQRPRRRRRADRRQIPDDRPCRARHAIHQLLLEFPVAVRPPLAKHVLAVARERGRQQTPAIASKLPRCPSVETVRYQYQLLLQPMPLCIRPIPSLQELPIAAQQGRRLLAHQRELASPLLVQARRRNDDHPSARSNHAMGQCYCDARLAHTDLVGKDRAVVPKACAQGTQGFPLTFNQCQPPSHIRPAIAEQHFGLRGNLFPADHLLHSRPSSDANPA
uniref:Uncharacterized protein n=1 Tax=Heterorhabditis bacteriophora TaxID=37862 RepID=A0A1I7WDC6_HETBA